MKLHNIGQSLTNRSHRDHRSGQSTVEYILLVAAVIAVMIILLTNNGAGVRGQLSTTVNTVTNTMDVHADRLQSSHSSDAGGESRPQINVDVIREVPAEGALRDVIGNPNVVNAPNE